MSIPYYIVRGVPETANLSLGDEERVAYAELERARPLETLVLYARMNPPPPSWFNEHDDILPDESSEDE